MKLEVGMYIRFNGFITKIDHLHETKNGNLYIQFKEPNGMNSSINKNWFDGKASYNIIDLLEEGDYVNGHEVTNITNLYIDIGEDENYVLLSSEEIKSIVTKEQYEKMEYKI